MHIEISSNAVGNLISAALTAAALWGAVILPLRRQLNRWELFWRDWAGEPARPGVPYRPGMMERMENHDVQLAEVRAQLRTNGGSSLRDAVNDTRASVDQLRRQIDRSTVILPQQAPAIGPAGAGE